MPDVQILIYAHREDQHRHEPYREWLEALVVSNAPFAVSTLVAVGFVRIVTRFKDDPTPLSKAIAVVDDLLALPGCEVRSPGTRHWTLLKELALSAGAVGKGFADAQHAAIAMEHDCEWVSADGGFARFEGCGLRWRHLDL